LQRDLEKEKAKRKTAEAEAKQLREQLKRNR
jgi:hypothetical protein